MTDERQPHDADDQVEDLEVSKEEARDVKGGKKIRKAGGSSEDYYEVKLEDIQT